MKLWEELGSNGLEGRFEGLEKRRYLVFLKYFCSSGYLSGYLSVEMRLGRIVREVCGSCCFCRVMIVVNF